MRFQRICVIVLDSVGVGELPDADRYGDRGTNTLGHIAESIPSIALPNLQKMGLGCIIPLQGIPSVEKPTAYYGKMAEASIGKDTMTGHWELMGLNVDIPFQTYPHGFPAALIDQFEKLTGRKVIGNKPASGTEILNELGEEQLKTGSWIVYTSADSVFQIAAHEQFIPLDELYRACEIARTLTYADEFAVGRVIARPYLGEPGAFKRTSNRHDYAVKPPAPTVLNQLSARGLASIGVGKINDIFSGEGITEALHTTSNTDGVIQTLGVMNKRFEGICFTNLVEFDSLYGHRRDPEGYAEALMAFDARLPEIMAHIGTHDLLILTADHGNDPTHSGTDHTREYVPLLVWNPVFTAPSSLGTRATFADLAATISQNFEIEQVGVGVSFLDQLI